jgi:Kinetochore complex Sim4 subunit Fta1
LVSKLAPTLESWHITKPHAEQRRAPQALVFTYISGCATWRFLKVHLMATSAIERSQIRAQDFLSLYDVSWTLHRLQWPTLSNRPYSLLSHSRNRANRAKQMQEFLHIDMVGEEAEITFDEKAGAIRKCHWELLEAADGEEGAFIVDSEGRRVTEELGSGIVITFVYDTATYTAVLYGPSPSEASSSAAANSETSSLPLLLTKTPVPLTKRIFTFLLDTFDVRISPLKLPQSLLQSTLESYITIITQYTTSMSLARRNGILKTILKDIKITLAFGPPVNPHLRTLDADLLADTVCNLIETANASRTSFLQVLSDHLAHHIGMELPLAGAGNNAEDAQQMTRISKIVSNAFALSGDGRFKIVEKARSAAEVENMGIVVRQANEMVLGSMLAEAIRPAG